ncbi:MAG: F0F1 ATP synthase subunit A [Anaeroplasmataceae bacterium]
MMEYLRNIPEQVKSTVMITLVLIIIIIFIGWRLKKVSATGKTPKWIVPFIILVGMVNDFTKTNLGRRWKAYAPYFLSLGIFLFFANISSVFGMTNPTSYLVVNAALATISFFIVQFTGMVSLGIKGYASSFVGPLKPLAPVMIPINIIGDLALPVSLSLRLLGNIISGTVISMLIKSFLGWGAIIPLPFVNAIFDIGFGLIQAFVFVVLTIIFTSMKIDDKEKIYD